MAVVVSRYRSASVIVFASVAFAAFAVALPAHVDLDPFVHFLLSCKERKMRTIKLDVCIELMRHGKVQCYRKRNGVAECNITLTFQPFVHLHNSLFRRNQAN